MTLVSKLSLASTLAMNLKEIKEKYKGGLEGRKGGDDVIIISKEGNFKEVKDYKVKR